MDAIRLLKTQHTEVKALFKKYKTAKGSEGKRELFEKIADDLAAHTEIEEKVFYPAAYVGEMKGLLREAVEEHLAAKRTLADLLEMNAEDENFDAKMKVLQDLIEHHIEEEEGPLFKKVRANLDSRELEALGTEMEERFQVLKQREPRLNVPAETGQAAPLP